MDMGTVWMDGYRTLATWPGLPSLAARTRTSTGAKHHDDTGFLILSLTVTRALLSAYTVRQGIAKGQMPGRLVAWSLVPHAARKSEVLASSMEAGAGRVGSG
jgi:cytochrome b561